MFAPVDKRWHFQPPLNRISICTVPRYHVSEIFSQPNDCIWTQSCHHIAVCRSVYGYDSALSLPCLLSDHVRQSCGCSSHRYTECSLLPLLLYTPLCHPQVVASGMLTVTSRQTAKSAFLFHWIFTRNNYACCRVECGGGGTWERETVVVWNVVVVGREKGKLLFCGTPTTPALTLSLKLITA